MIAYIKPYEGEVEIVNEALPEQHCIFVDSVGALTAEQKETITILSVFVDVVVSKELINTLPQLTAIVTRSAGYDHIDMEAANARKIVVLRVPHYGVRTVAEYAVALMFALSRKAFQAYVDLQQRTDLSDLSAYEGFDLYGKTLGVIGTGAIGKSVCELATGIGMKVAAYDVSPDDGWAIATNVTYATLEEVLTAADIVTLHVPSLPQTHHLINAERLALMKSGSYLINTARGEVVDTHALIEALHKGHIAGAGLDVLEGEHELREEAALLQGRGVDAALWKMLVADHILIDMPNVIVTPHVAFNTSEAKREITEITVANILSLQSGEVVNAVTV